MRRFGFFIIFVFFSVFFMTLVIGRTVIYAQETPPAETPAIINTGINLPEIKPQLSQTSVGDAILKFLKPEEFFNALQKYIRVPLPGTGVQDIEINKRNIGELNREVALNTGVDIIKFLKFIGNLAVLILENAARIIRGFISGI